MRAIADQTERSMGPSPRRSRDGPEPLRPVREGVAYATRHRLKANGISRAVHASDAAES